ncbi:hypothetical protein RB195_000017 [Necator americanus]|uniref:Uncharacterized protein n=1 Tax=Necator americanus TaxID=51031 RepID=A0ABR1D7K2_NECAM
MMSAKQVSKQARKEVNERFYGRVVKGVASFCRGYSLLPREKVSSVSEENWTSFTRGGRNLVNERNLRDNPFYEASLTQVSTVLLCYYISRISFPSQPCRQFKSFILFCLYERSFIEFLKRTL